MKKYLSIMFLFVIAFSALANVPYRAVINGPSKIGCGSVYKYKVTLEGLGEEYIDNPHDGWYPLPPDASLYVSGQYATVTAPNTAMNLILECDVRIASPHNHYGTETLHASLTINVIDPTFIVTRENMSGDNVTTTSSIPIFGNVDYDGEQDLTDGDSSLSFFDDELLYFSVDVSDASLIANRGTVKLSVPADYRFWDDKDRGNLLGNSGANITIVLDDLVELNDALFNVSGAVEARNTGKGKDFKFSFNSTDTFLPYFSYGLKHIQKPSNYDQIQSAVNAKLPALSDCQWRCCIDEAFSDHDNIAYSVVPTPNVTIYNGKHFSVYKTTPLCSNVNLLAEYNGGWATSMDSFGNRNGNFEITDIYDFFHSFKWGGMDLVGTIDCRVIYYDGFWAARSIPKKPNDYLMSNWRLFRTKIGNYLIDYIVEDSSNILMMFGQGEQPL